MNAIKIGHYCKTNAWSRIAHRGFYSCRCPDEIRWKVSVEDFDLLYWFPNLTVKDEKNIHKQLNPFRICGEWFRGESIELLPQLVKEENRATECSKDDALNTRRRL